MKHLLARLIYTLARIGDDALAQLDDEEDAPDVAA